MGTINVTWWNLQNFFDTDDDPISKDFQYTAAHGWTQPVFEAKKTNLANALNATHSGAGPELLAVAEIEKDALLRELIIAMGKPHLKVVADPTGTKDLRGIDVAMAYDDRKLRVKSSKTHLVHLRYRTRDIFEVVFDVLGAGEELVVIAGHWPSRSRGRYESEPVRIAVAEHTAFLVEDHVKVQPEEYERLRAASDIQTVRDRWERRVLVVGDFNDEPGDRSVVEHLQASNDLDRVIGPTNDIDGFEDETADYRAQDVFVFNASWKFAGGRMTGTFFLDGTTQGGKATNRYQVLDQMVASRGLVSGAGVALDLNSVDIFRDPIVATSSFRPRRYDKSTRKGTSDHLPVTAVLRW